MEQRVLAKQIGLNVVLQQSLCLLDKVLQKLSCKADNLLETWQAAASRVSTTNGSPCTANKSMTRRKVGKERQHANQN